MEQLTFLITPVDEPEPYQPEIGEGWYGVALRYYPNKANLDEGRAEIAETMIYAKTLLAAKQQASKWAKGICEQHPVSAIYPIEKAWAEVSSSTNKYGKMWKKTGIFYTCNPELYLVPNSIHTEPQGDTDA